MSENKQEIKKEFGKGWPLMTEEELEIIEKIALNHPVYRNFLCPIDGSLMRDPSLAKKITYNKAAIEERLRSKPQSPTTSESFSLSQLREDVTIRAAIIALITKELLVIRQDKDGKKDAKIQRVVEVVEQNPARVLEGNTAWEEELLALREEKAQLKAELRREDRTKFIFLMCIAFMTPLAITFSVLSFFGPDGNIPPRELDARRKLSECMNGKPTLVDSPIVPLLERAGVLTQKTELGAREQLSECINPERLRKIPQFPDLSIMRYSEDSLQNAKYPYSEEENRLYQSVKGDLFFVLHGIKGSLSVLEKRVLPVFERIQEKNKGKGNLHLLEWLHKFTQKNILKDLSRFGIQGSKNEQLVEIERRIHFAKHSLEVPLEIIKPPVETSMASVSFTTPESTCSYDPYSNLFGRAANKQDACPAGLNYQDPAAQPGISPNG